MKIAGMVKVGCVAWLMLSAPAWASWVETFDTKPTDRRWTYGGTWASPSGPVFSGGAMEVRCAELSQCRAIWEQPLLSGAEIIVTGSTYVTKDGTTLSTHARNYIGLYHGGTTTDRSLQLLEGNPGVEGNRFGEDTHYTVDITTKVGYSKAFSAKILRTDNVISLALWNTSKMAWVTTNTYTLVSPTLPLYFEVASIDGSSKSAGGVRISEFTFTPEPASTATLLTIGIGGLAAFRRRYF